VSQYIVRPGDYLSKIAHAHGFSDWHTIYDDSSNAAFRRLRPNPNLIYPGDSLNIPERPARTLPAPAGARTRFSTHRHDDHLELLLRDFRGEPLRSVPCRLSVDGVASDVTADGDGRLSCDIARGVEDVRVDVAGVTLVLRIGHMNPMDNTDDNGVSGIKGRLYNLGYYNGPLDGRHDDLTASAISAFERDNGMTETGEVSGALKEKLHEKFGS